MAMVAAMTKTKVNTKQLYAYKEDQQRYHHKNNNNFHIKVLKLARQ
jgi:hypothetical protein